MVAAAQSPLEPALLALAREKFGPLSRAEEELFRAAQEGRVASALTGEEKEDDPAEAANWKTDRAVRAKCLSWVCTDPSASALLTHQGMDLHGMRLDGVLDLENADITFSLRARKCAFSEHIFLRDAQMRGFYLVDCHIKSLDASRAIFKGSVLLRGKGFQAKGEVNLCGARIDGNLDCDGARFTNVEARALFVNGAKIERAVFLRHIEARGEVNLVAATIGNALECSGAHLSGTEGTALVASGANIDGNVLFHKTLAIGEIRLKGAAISGDLECDGSQFSNAKGVAFSANRAQIDGSVFFCEGFKAEGEVNLVSSKIGGSVFLRDGFEAVGEVNLVQTRMRGLQIRGVVAAEQTIFDLRLAEVGTFFDDEGSWPKAGDLFLDGFRYERLYEEAPFEADKRKKWLSLQPPERFRPQPYEQLGAVLRQMGHTREARLMMIEKNRERARFTHFPQQSWWWFNLFGRLIGYGYAPWRAFAMSLAMILLGYLLFYVGSIHGIISPTTENAYQKASNGQVIEENGRKKLSENYPVFNAFVYSLESFVPLLKLDQSVNWKPNANRGAQIEFLRFWTPHSGELLRYYLYFHIAMGWLLTSLWVGAITGLVKT